MNIKQVTVFGGSGFVQLGFEIFDFGFQGFNLC